ncbi:hypothetical protein AB5N19_12451 [Seiridium cardinale]
MSSIPFPQFVSEQFRHLPLAVSSETCSGGTYIVTGANTGLGLEAARHLANLGSKKVIMGVRNAKAGDEARRDIESTTKTRGVVEVWPLDLCDYDSVKAFAKRAIEQLERIDAVIENASVAYDTFKLTQGHEESIVINVLSNFLLAALLLPKLKESAKRFGILPHLVIVGSEVAFMDMAKIELDKVKDEPLRKMDDDNLCIMKNRYPFTKLIQFLLLRQLASLLPVAQNGVVLNFTNPGLCKTGLSRHAKFWSRMQITIAKNILGRTAEQGSRNLLFGTVAGRDSHGCFTGNCEIEEDRVPDWITDEEGQRTQQRVWDDIVKELELVEPGCVQNALR